MRKWEMVTDYLVEFLQQELYKTGLKKAVLGLSGGLDSAVVAVLAKKAFGDDLLCVMMPSQYSSDESVDDAVILCEAFGLRYEKVFVGDLVASYCDETMSPLRKGNFSSRMRMSVLFDISAREGALVLGTSNKSELMLGYGTLNGDLASAINALGDMYKTDVYALARHLGVVDEIINKAPSADLFAGQSDEADLGYTYAQIDEALELYVDKRASKEEAITAGIEPALMDMLIKRIYGNQFKRRPPVIAKLTSRSINHDFNYARDINQ